MSVSALEVAAHCDEDHGLGDVDPGFVVSHEAPPSDHPSEGSFRDPPAGQNLEALLGVGPSDHLYDEVEAGGFVHELDTRINRPL